jgi:hypothetical protein
MGSLAAIDTELPPPRVESYAMVSTRHQGSASAVLRGQRGSGADPCRFFCLRERGPIGDRKLSPQESHCKHGYPALLRV